MPYILRLFKIEELTNFRYDDEKSILVELAKDIVNNAKEIANLIDASFHEYIENFNKSGIRKEISKIPYEDISNKLFDMADDNAREYAKTVDATIDYLSDLSTVKFKNSFKDVYYEPTTKRTRSGFFTEPDISHIKGFQLLGLELSEFAKHIAKLKHIIKLSFIDEYTLARLFKTSDFKDIIIYAGEAHAIVYREFLDEFQFETLNQTYNINYLPDLFIENNIQCIDVKDFKFEINPEPYCEWKGDDDEKDMIYVYSYKMTDRLCMPRHEFINKTPIDGLVSLSTDLVISERIHNKIADALGKNLDIKFVNLRKKNRREVVYSDYELYESFQTAERNPIKTVKTYKIRRHVDDESSVQDSSPVRQYD
jgi:hypothetical protein